MAFEGSKAYIEDLTGDKSADGTDNEPSEIAQFFAGRKILITGGSGFMGKLIIEKLLRSCPDVAKLYVFMRDKRNKSSQERFKEHFEDIIYDVLKAQQPNFYEKVVLIEGDVGLIDLGLSEENRKLLLDTEIVIHGAATVSFDEKLRVATYINVRGTKQVLLLAKEMANLKAFVHISTAFSNCTMKVIEEKFYEPPLEADKLLSLVDILEDEKLNKITPTLLGDFPNTYIFTKAIAEETVRRYSTGIPICIVRPSMVISTANEPLKGWTNNLYGPTGAVVGAGIGLLRSLHCVPEYIADIIPGDYVVANIIVAAWDTAVHQRVPPSLADSPREVFEKPDGDGDADADADFLPIYNVVSSCQNPITWHEFSKFNEIYGICEPSAKTFWYYFFTMNRNIHVHNLFIIFLHYMPALIVDTLAMMTGRKPRLFKIYRKVNKFCGVVSYFSSNQWRFKNGNVLQLVKRTSPTDLQIFNFDLTTLNWSDYFYHHIRGLRVYLMKEPLDNLDVARVRFRRLKVAHYTLVSLFWLVVAYYVYLLMGYVWSSCPFSH